MPVPSSISDLSTNPLLNSPAGTDPINTTLDDYLRAIQGIVKAQFAQGAAVAVTGATITLPETGSTFVVSAASPQTVTSISSNFTGRQATLIFADGNVTLSNGTNLILGDGANVTPAAGDTITFVSTGSGIWRSQNSFVTILKNDGSTKVNVNVN